MSFQAMAWASKQKMPAAKKSLLYTLANYCGHDGKLWPSYQTLADDSGMSKRSVIKHMRDFEESGIVGKMYRAKTNGDSDSNMWILSAYIGSEESSPPSEQAAPPSDDVAPPLVQSVHQGSEQAAPEPVIDPVIKPITEPKQQGSASGDDSPASNDSNVVRDFPLKDGSDYFLPEEFADELKGTYQKLDVEHHLKRARLWLIANPAKQKTKRGMPKFLNGWMDRQKPTAEIHQFQSRHTGFDDRDYSEGLIEGVSDDAANF